MKKVIKITLIAIAVFFVVLVLYLNYQTHFSKAAREGKANIENIKKVRKGMSEEIVFKIMGEPDLVDYCDIDSTLKGYNYNTNDESWMYVTVCFDSTMTVKETHYPKNY
jgi:outer membrane protein assembly factor BamE (lipoprotein component of BamABCDE complex)